MSTPRRAATVAASATAAALAAAGLAATATAQQAPATVSADWANQSVTYVAGDGQVNNLYVTAMGDGSPGNRRIGFNDEVPIEPGDHCSYENPADDTFVVCELPKDGELPDDVRVDLGDGDDEIFTSDPGVSVVHGGPGDDTLHAHTAHTIAGDDGDDMLMGGVVMHGGDGADHLVGDERDQELRGGRGDDVIEAFDGDDLVYGNSGDDEIRGGRGDDVLYGGPGDDVLYGNSGNDVVAGGPGRDVLSGGPGEDEVTQ